MLGRIWGSYIHTWYILGYMEVLPRNVRSYMLMNAVVSAHVIDVITDECCHHCWVILEEYIYNLKAEMFGSLFKGPVNGP